MKLFELVLYQSCNYSCSDCPMKQWLYSPDEIDKNGIRRNAITNEALFEWVDKYLNPREWFIEITGGEPGLYPEITTLITGLIRRNYKGIIRTNGSQILPGLPSFKRVAAWHKDQPFPVSYDYIIILENSKDDYKAKEKYCIENKIPHVVFPYFHFGTDQCKEGTDYPPQINKYFREMTTMFSSGAITGCFAGQADLELGASLQKMSKPILHDIRGCRFCGNITAIEYFIDNIPNFKKKMKEKFIMNESTEKVLNALDVEELDTSPESLIRYPILDIDNNWVDKDGNIVGKLGDNLDELNKLYGDFGGDN